MFTAFSQGFTALRRHPWLFLLLIAVEAIFFTSLALLLYSFAATFMSSLQAMDDFLLAQPWMTADPSQQNLADLNIPATDLSVMQLHNAAISRAALVLVLWGGVLFVFSRALSYTLSSSIAVREPSRGLAVRLGTSLLVAAVFVAAMMYLGWTVIVGLVGNFFGPEGSAAPLYILPLLGLLALLYLFPLALSLCQTHPLTGIPLALLRLGFFSFFRIMGNYMAILLLAALPVLPLLFFTEHSFWMDAVLLLPALAALVYGRIVVVCLASGLIRAKKS